MPSPGASKGLTGNSERAGTDLVQLPTEDRLRSHPTTLPPLLPSGALPDRVRLVGPRHHRHSMAGNGTKQMTPHATQSRGVGCSLRCVSSAACYPAYGNPEDTMHPGDCGTWLANSLPFISKLGSSWLAVGFELPCERRVLQIARGFSGLIAVEASSAASGSLAVMQRASLESKSLFHGSSAVRRCEPRPWVDRLARRM